jgi:hypothetical protein
VAKAVRFRAGEGELSYGRVLRQALGMLRAEFGRVAIVALILFVPPPLLIAALDGVRESLEIDRTIVQGAGLIISLLLVTTIRLFGPVVYAGYLEEAVGSEYFRGEKHRFRDVLKKLPWVRLVIAEIILVVGTTVGLALFVVPGIIFITVFVLVGPVIVQERLGVIAAFRRTYQLSRPVWKMVFILVVVFIGVEHAVAELFHELLHDRSLVAQVGVEWAIAAVLGGTVGLLEVALATELIARRPATTEPPPQS